MALENDEFGWKDMEIAVDGKVLVAVTEFGFSEEIESELVYGKGNLPISIQDGNVKYEGNLTVMKSDLDRLVAATGNVGVVGLKNLTFTVALVKDGKISTRTLVKARITKLPEDWKQNDKFATMQLPFIFLRVIY
jgi:hypothetical protein